MDVDRQFEILNEIVLNIENNFSRNNVNTVDDGEPKKKKDAYEKNVTNPQDNVAFSQFNNTCEELIKAIKEYRNEYLMYLSNNGPSGAGGGRIAVSPRSLPQSFLSMCPFFEEP